VVTPLAHPNGVVNIYNPGPLRQMKISSGFAERIWRSWIIAGAWEEK
jgi:hypothetical protein